MVLGGGGQRLRARAARRPEARAARLRRSAGAPGSRRSGRETGALEQVWLPAAPPRAGPPLVPELTVDAAPPPQHQLPRGGADADRRRGGGVRARTSGPILTDDTMVGRAPLNRARPPPCHHRTTCPSRSLKRISTSSSIDRQRRHNRIVPPVSTVRQDGARASPTLSDRSVTCSPKRLSIVRPAPLVDRSKAGRAILPFLAFQNPYQLPASLGAIQVLLRHCEDRMRTLVRKHDPCAHVCSGRSTATTRKPSFGLLIGRRS